MGLMGPLMAHYAALGGIQSGFTKSTDDPSIVSPNQQVRNGSRGWTGAPGTRILNPH